MARPIKHRRICALPQVSEFIPVSSPCTDHVEMTVDEFETIRLIDHMGLSQQDCAAQMHVARTTVQGIYDTARRKLADALVSGKRLKIRGGCYDLCPHAHGCCGNKRGRRSGGPKQCKNGLSQNCCQSHDD